MTIKDTLSLAEYDVLVNAVSTATGTPPSHTEPFVRATLAGISHPALMMTPAEVDALATAGETDPDAVEKWLASNQDRQLAFKTRFPQIYDAYQQMLSMRMTMRAVQTNNLPKKTKGSAP
jgi:hypothetical protein